jgi:hypothetical protein
MGVVLSIHHRYSKSICLEIIFDVFTAMKFQVEVFWVVTPCNFVVGYQLFEGPNRLLLQGEVKMEAALFFRSLVSYHNTTLRRNP